MWVEIHQGSGYWLLGTGYCNATVQLVVPFQVSGEIAVWKVWREKWPVVCINMLVMASEWRVGIGVSVGMASRSCTFGELDRAGSRAARTGRKALS